MYSFAGLEWQGSDGGEMTESLRVMGERVEWLSTAANLLCCSSEQLVGETQNVSLRYWIDHNVIAEYELR